MKALVTGGSGFIGSHICELLINKGLEVLCVDNLSTGSERNINHLKKSKKFKFLRLDVTKDEINQKNINYIFHFASPASPVAYQHLEEETALVNSFGTHKMLKLAVNNNARFLYASTSEIYGDPLEHPQKESYWGNVNTFGPRSCYDEAKRFGETLVYIYLHKHKIDARIIRIFNTYGPRMQKDDGRVISNFINQALEGKDITIYGNGSQTRSFCYVSDLVSGIDKVMFTDSLEGEIFNLGNPEEYTIIDLAEKIKSLTGSKSNVVFKPLPVNDPVRRRPDITKAKTKLGWEPDVSVNEGLKKTIEYYKELV